MNNEIYDDLALEQIALEKFGLDIDIRQVIVRQIPVSYTAEATVFLTSKKQLFAFVSGPSKLLLSDVKKIISRMGLKAELFLPPKGQPDYFDRISKEDLIFYRTLAPYNPALVQIQEVKSGEIFKYDTDAASGWRSAVKFAYRRIKTS